MLNEPLEVTQARAQGIDLGLQAFMQNVFRKMGLGLVLTGITAYLVASTPALAHLILGNHLVFMIVAFSPLAFVLFGFTPGRMAAMSASSLGLLFAAFSVVQGLSLSTIFFAYSGVSITRVFFITAATFAGTALYGATTKRDLSGFGGFLTMGLLGLVIASVVNMFLRSTGMDFVLSCIGVIVFTGLTAWETQRLRLMYRPGDEEGNAKMAVAGALSMYLDFINLFMSLLRLFGNRR